MTARRPALRQTLLWTVGGIVALALVATVVVFGAGKLNAVRWEAQPTPSPSSSSSGPPPSRLRIPTIGVDASLVDLRLDANGALEAPKDYNTPGWYADGTRPGDPGPAVIAGHFDTKKGPAIFYKLPQLRAGNEVEVLRGERWVKFKVLAVRRYAKDKFPTDEVYAPTPNAQLRLITCGGAFDNSSGHYVDNWVVYAVAT
jgi:sortase (surface protein transpeptidase)